jgi:hypothetical protein
LVIACGLVVALDLVVVADRVQHGEQAQAAEGGVPTSRVPVAADPVVTATLDQRLLDLSTQGFTLADTAASDGLTGPLDRHAAAALDEVTADEIEVLLGELGYVAGQSRFWNGAQFDVLNFVWSFGDPASATRYVDLARRDYQADRSIELVTIPAVPGATGYRTTAPHAGSEVVFAAGHEVYAVVVVGEVLPATELIASLVAAQFARAVGA